MGSDTSISTETHKLLLVLKTLPAYVYDAIVTTPSLNLLCPQARGSEEGARLL